MERVHIEREIARILGEMGVREERLSPTARLLHDLRIDGDDAAEFFDAVGTRFGMDLTVLREDWSLHFNPEGLSLVPVVKVMTGAAVAGAATALAGLSLLVCLALAALGGAVAWLLGKPDDTVASRAIHLGEVVEAVERGCWRRSPGEDRQGSERCRLLRSAADRGGDG